MKQQYHFVSFNYIQQYDINIQNFNHTTVRNTIILIWYRCLILDCLYHLMYHIKLINLITFIILIQYMILYILSQHRSLKCVRLKDFNVASHGL